MVEVKRSSNGNQRCGNLRSQKPKMTTCEIWEHGHLHEFAVRIEDGVVAGVCSISLDFACDPDGRLHALAYDSSPTVLLRFKEHSEQFCQFEPWMKGKRVPVGPAGMEKICVSGGGFISG